jgi:uncharacterized membrane protein YtjA (UPF0391 family)
VYGYCREIILRRTEGLSAESCILEVLRSGTMSFIESMIAGHYGFDGIAEMGSASGIRAALSEIVMDMPSCATASGSTYLGIIEDPQESFDQALARYGYTPLFCTSGLE